MSSKIILLMCVLLAIPFLMIAGGLILNDLPWNDPPGFGKRLSTYLNNNDVRTTVDSVFPELVPRRYALDSDELKKVIAESVASLEWKIEEPFQQTNTMHVLVTTRLFSFKDDIYITLEQEKAGTQFVNVRSVSRVGKGDLGANTRHVIDFYAELDKAFARAGQ